MTHRRSAQRKGASVVSSNSVILEDGSTVEDHIEEMETAIDRLEESKGYTISVTDETLEIVEQEGDNHG